MPLALPNVPHEHRAQPTPAPFQEVEVDLTQTGQETHPQVGDLVTAQDADASLPEV
jgi:hypothetical protein